MRPPEATNRVVSRLLQFILNRQANSGAFHSSVHFDSRCTDDWNGFTTALILRALGSVPLGPAWEIARGRALEFLETCEARDRPGFFGFWPQSQWPRWAPHLPEDADDTAAITLELLRYGRINLRTARRTVRTALLPYRLAAKTKHSPTWMRPGAFLTWLRNGLPVNLIDCCVNTNVIALMAKVGLTRHPAYTEASSMVQAGIHWAARSWTRLGSLLPYYPEPSELLLAVSHAVSCGAQSMRPCLRELLCFPDREPPCGLGAMHQQPLFSTPDRRLIWTSHVLVAARRLQSVLGPRGNFRDASSHRAGRGL